MSPRLPLPPQAKLARWAVRYGPFVLPYVRKLYEHGRWRQLAILHARTVEDGAFSWEMHGGERIWVVWTADEVVATYPHRDERRRQPAAPCCRAPGRRGGRTPTRSPSAASAGASTRRAARRGDDAPRGRRRRGLSGRQTPAPCPDRRPRTATHAGATSWSSTVPEGHTIHRLARRHGEWFAGQPVAVSSPQGRFAGADRVDGHVLRDTSAWGKHLFHHYDAGRRARPPRAVRQVLHPRGHATRAARHLPDARGRPRTARSTSSGRSPASCSPPARSTTLTAGLGPRPAARRRRPSSRPGRRCSASASASAAHCWTSRCSPASATSTAPRCCSPTPCTPRSRPPRSTATRSSRCGAQLRDVAAVGGAHRPHRHHGPRRARHGRAADATARDPLRLQAGRLPALRHRHPPLGPRRSLGLRLRDLPARP